VYALTPNKARSGAEKVHVIARGLNSPNGVAFHAGVLYVAQMDGVLAYANIENNLKQPPKPVIINVSFPSDRHHGWKYIAIGPDNKLYIPVGAPCNVCLKEDPRYASIMRMALDGSDLEIYTKGVRNTAGFA